MKKHSVILCPALLAMGALLFGTSFISCKREEPEPQVTKVEQILITDIDGENTSTYVEEEDFIILTARVIPDNATDKTIFWESSNEELLSVSEDGKVTAAALTDGQTSEKTATIRATAQDGSEVYAEIEVEVLAKKKHVQSIAITSKYGNNILKGEDTPLTITVLPEDAADKTFTVKSSDESILKIQKNSSGAYEAIGTGKGDATITVTANDRYQNAHKSTEYAVKVLGEKIDLTSIALTASELVEQEANVVFTGTSAALEVAKVPADATLSRESGVTYSITSGESLASVDENGIVTFGESAGIVTVKAVAQDRSQNKREANITFTVRKPVESVEIQAPEGTKTDGETILLSREDDSDTQEDDREVSLTATVAPEDATAKALKWESSDPSIAEVDQSGKVSAKKAGEATITASTTDGSKIIAQQKVHVFIPVTAITVSAAKSKGECLSTIALTIAVTPTDADSSVFYEVTEGSASVNANGVVTLGDIAENVTVVATSKTNANKTSTISLTSELNKTGLQTAISKATEKLEIVGDNTTDDITEVGKYLTARKASVESAKSAAEEQNASGTKQSKINEATETLLNAVEACSPLSITPAKDAIPEYAEYTLFASGSNTDGTSLSEGLVGSASNEPSEADVYENYPTTEEGKSVKHVKVESAFGITVGNHNATPADGMNNRIHISLFTSKKVSMGLAIWEPYNLPGVGPVLPSVSFDPATGKVTSELRKPDGDIIEEAEGFESREVGGATVGSDNWWSVDFTWSDLYEKQAMNENFYGLVFFPTGESTSEFFFDNLYVYKAAKTKAELVAENKLKLKKTISDANALYERINGNESESAFDYGKYHTGTAAALLGEIGIAQAEFESSASTSLTVTNAKTRLELAIETAKGNEIVEKFNAPSPLARTTSLFTIYTSDSNVTVGTKTNLTNANGDGQSFALNKIEYTDYAVDGRTVKKVSLTESSPLHFTTEWEKVGAAIADENKLTLHLSLYTRNDVEFQVAIWNDKHYAYKVDAKNLKVTSDDEEVGTVAVDANNWLDVKIDVTGYKEKHGNMFSIAFITDVEQYFYFDNFFFYEEEPSGEALILARQAKLNAALETSSTILNAAHPGNTPGKYPQSAINTFQTAYNSASAVRNSEDASELLNAITSLENALASFEASCIVVTFTKTNDALSAESFKTSLTKNLKDTAFTSSSAIDANTADKAFDGNTGTRWESAQTDSEWLSIDFGKKVTFNTIRFMWEGAYTKHYKIEISEDGSVWDSILEVKDGTGGSETIKMNTAITSQHVRFQAMERGTTYGNSFWEMGISNE